jgi:CubicO group peptidase (beta-lactamase class C family)
MLLTTMLQPDSIREAQLEKLNSRLGDFVSKGKIAGTVTLIAHRGRVVSVAAHGWQDIEAKVPMKDDTIFRVYSMSKPVTAAAVIILVEEGKLSLKDRIDKHLPEFAHLATKPTIQQVLAHQGGFSSDNPGGMDDDVRAASTLGEFVKKIAAEPLAYEPGKEYRYSGPGYAVAGRLVEVASGQEYETFLQTRIFGPLKMKDTTNFLPRAKAARLAHIYGEADGGLQKAEFGAPIFDAKFAGPAGGLYSTARDMWAFFQMLANGGKLNGARVLSPASVDTMTQIHSGSFMTGSTDASGYGLGLTIAKSPIGALTLSSPGSFGHPGAIGTHGWVDPKRNLVGIFMSQHTGTTEVRDIFMSMATAAVED